MNKKIFFAIFSYFLCNTIYAAGTNNVLPVIALFKHDPYAGYQKPTEEEVRNWEKQNIEQQQNHKNQIQRLNRFYGDQSQPFSNSQKEPDSKTVMFMKQFIPNATIRVANPVTFIQDIQQKMLQSFDPNKKITTDDIKQIKMLEEQNPKIFTEAMEYNDFALQRLKGLLVIFQSCNTNDIIKTHYFIKDSVLSLLTKYCSSEQLNEIAPETGQNIVHLSTPWHWLPNYMYELSKKARLDIPTGKNDKHPGSTIFHSLAQQLRNINCNNQPHQKKQSIEQFLTIFLPKYPHVLIQCSLQNTSNANSAKSCWHILPTDFKDTIYQLLSPEAIRTIHEELDKFQNKNFTNTMKQEFPLKK